MKELEILKSRRVWVVIISGVMFALSSLGVNLDINTDTLSGLIVNAMEPISQVIVAVLAIWSYLKPKPKSKSKK